MDTLTHISDHLWLLSGILTSLVLWGVFPKATAYKWIILVLSGLSIRSVLVDFPLSEESILHISFDFLSIGIIGILITLLQNKYLKFAFLPLALFLLIYSHNKWIVPVEGWNKEAPRTIETLDASSELLIHLKDPSAFRRIQKEFGNEIVSIESAFDMADNPNSILDEYFAIDVKNDIDLKTLISKLSKHNNVLDVEMNQQISVGPFDLGQEQFKVSKSKKTNDPFIDDQWISDVYDIGGIHKKLKKRKTQNNNLALIAILDTGVDSKHEDLQANYKSIDTKYDNDERGHGTHCAGIAAAVSNNKIGIASLIPDQSFVQVTSVKVLNRMGIGSQRTIIKGMIRAVDEGADVISMSLGTYTSESKEKAYTAAVEYASKKNVIVIAAAGNSSANAINFSPANTPGILTVAALDITLQLATFSNTIDDIQMGIAAPGVKIMSTIPNNQYHKYDGTSMAAPFVAGLAGLAKSIDPTIDTKSFHKLIYTTAKKVNNLSIASPADALDGLLGD